MRRMRLVDAERTWIYGTAVGRKVEIIADYRSTPCDQAGTSEHDGQLINPGFEIVFIAEV